MTDLDALEAVLAGDTLAGYTAVYDAAPALISEHRRMAARIAELEEGWKTLLKIIEKSVHPKEPPHRMIFADDHIETGRAVDAYVRMMQKMQTVARAALEPKP